MKKKLHITLLGLGLALGAGLRRTLAYLRDPGRHASMPTSFFLLSLVFVIPASIGRTE